MSVSQQVYTSHAGSFATSRRGGLTHDQIREIEAHRAKERPTPWQALSARYGKPVEDIRAVLAAPCAAVVPAEPTKPGAETWTVRDERRLRVMFIDLDLPATLVADAMGRSRESIIGKASRMGLKKRGVAR